MLRKLADWIHRKERALHAAGGNDISTPAARAEAWRHYLWLDHGILRFWWKNEDEIAPGVWRSNHPHHARFEVFQERGIKTVLNLRGTVPKSYYLFEQESVDQLGLTLVDVPMGAREFPRQQTLLDLLTAFETMEKPFVMHCKSGADRTGLAAALYLLIYTDGSDAEVRKQLSFKYIHIRKSKTGKLDYLINTYLARHAEIGIDVVSWIKTEYSKAEMSAAYDAMKADQKFWQGW